ncbi:MAG TPA: hypothetical protein VFY18_04235 [Candidatus Limnocylindrales bacterium]|nr:hypothetical protein [Candidatus Limnocylindrales bacterium]
MRPSILLGFGVNANPWWDSDGRTSRRRRRRLLEVALVVSTLALLMTTVWPRTARAGASVNLDQWASTDAAWQNGNLNGNNSRYPEGGIVPFRLAMEGLKAGNHTIHINYDVTAGGHKAYDFLATWNVTNAAGRICGGSGGGISSMCPGMPASSSAAFPNDGYAMDGLTVHGAELYSAAPRRLTIWGGTIQSISAPVHSGSASGNSSADIVVRFRSTGAAVLLAWGGHLGQSAYWNRSTGGASDGASQVSGAPWHMRTLQLDGAGNKNQDRSIQPSAIVGELGPFALAPPTPRPTAAPPAPRPTPATQPGAPTPRPPGQPGGPAVQGGDPPGVPNVTIPPTSTAPLLDADQPGLGSLLAALATSAIALLMLVPALRRRRPR